MQNLWQLKLQAIGQRFGRLAESSRINTLVIWAKDTPEGREVLKGPMKGHWLRDHSGIDNPVLPPAFVKVADEDYPLRAIYFGGIKKDASTFHDLIEDAGDLLDQPTIIRRIPSRYALRYGSTDAQCLSKSHPYSLGALLWVLLLHHFGQQDSKVLPYSLDRTAWLPDDPETTIPVDETPWPFFFTYSRNSFEASLGMADLLLSVPPRDVWIPILTAERLMGLNKDHFQRLIRTKTLRCHGKGIHRRISPRSILDYLAANPPIRQKPGSSDEAESNIKVRVSFAKANGFPIESCPSCGGDISPVKSGTSEFRCNSCTARFSIIRRS